MNSLYTHQQTLYELWLEGIRDKITRNLNFQSEKNFINIKLGNVKLDNTKLHETSFHFWDYASIKVYVSYSIFHSFIMPKWAISEA